MNLDFRIEKLSMWIMDAFYASVETNGLNPSLKGKPIGRRLDAEKRGVGAAPVTKQGNLGGP